jgi:hypothetical protein
VDAALCTLMHYSNILFLQLPFLINVHPPLLEKKLFLQEYTSPRIAAVYEETEGTIGSSSGTLNDTDALKEYFLHLVRTTSPAIQCELLSVLRGLNGSVAVVYERENSEIVAEYMKLENGRIVKVDVLYSTPG